MTAEIAVLNKSAVALAADSAVTSTGNNKIFNTVNKLFNLNKNQPVGIMIFGIANCLDVPWETIIKMYRIQKKGEYFDTIKEQGEDFINFIQDNLNFFPPDSQLESIKFRLHKTFQITVNGFQKKLEEMSRFSNLTNQDIRDLIEKELEYCSNFFEGLSYFNNYTIDDRKTFLDENKDILKEIHEYYFGDWQLEPSDFEILNNVSADIILKDYFPPDTLSGIVIAGFGKKEFYPSIISYNINGMYKNQLNYKLRESNSITNLRGSMIRAYAQTDVASMFIEGVSTEYKQALKSGLDYMGRAYRATIKNIPEIKNMSQDDQKSLLNALIDENSKLLNKFFDELEDNVQSSRIDPMMASINMLPKEELATMAESIIYLTHLKRRYSDDLETVGGEVDVAVISIGDGFIWIKRKHYFDKDLNPQFFVNQFKK